METKTIKGNNFVWKVNKKFNCETKNVAHIIECNKCKEQYIGETERALKDRLGEHKTCILEKMKQTDTIYRKEREAYLIRKFNTFNKGINKKP